jgi:hypothetical protein
MGKGSRGRGPNQSKIAAKSAPCLLGDHRAGAKGKLVTIRCFSFWCNPVSGVQAAVGRLPMPPATGCSGAATARREKTLSPTNRGPDPAGARTGLVGRRSGPRARRISQQTGLVPGRALGIFSGPQRLRIVMIELCFASPRASDEMLRGSDHRRSSSLLVYYSEASCTRTCHKNADPEPDRELYENQGSRKKNSEDHYTALELVKGAAKLVQTDPFPNPTALPAKAHRNHCLDNIGAPLGRFRPRGWIFRLVLVSFWLRCV